MTRSNTNCRTALVAPTASDSIREANSYEYDNNGNILYVNTLRLKPDMTAQPDTVQRTREEKFRWDEENRLTALSQNGYVSHYWYDADGERTIKMHGGNMGCSSTAHISLEVPYRCKQKDWKPFYKPFGKARKRIETIFSQFTDQFNIMRNYAKEWLGFFTRIISKVSALTVAQYINKINNRPIGRIKYALA